MTAMQRTGTGSRKTIWHFLSILIGVFFSLVVFALCFYVFWSVIDGPVVVFNETEVAVGVGTEYDPMSVIGEVRGIPQSHISMDSSELDLSVPGDYSVVFHVDTFPISRGTLERYHLGFLSPADRVETLTVHVVDSAAPVITAVNGPLSVMRGDTVRAEDLILSAEDETDVAISFDDGSTEIKCDEDGSKTVTVVVEDLGGNRSEAQIVIEVEGPDETAPVIEGADDVILQVGENFDPMEGVSAVDDRDGDVAVEIVSGTAPEMTHAGSSSIVYRAVDQTGNETKVTRNAAVYDQVAGEGALRFGLLWNSTGVAGQPYLVAVNRVRNIVTVFTTGADGNYNVPVQSFVCSVGTATPDGAYTTQERYRWHDLWENSFGQYAIRITGHILFHSVPYTTSEDPSTLEYEEYNKLGTSASLGCVRLCVADCKWLYDNCPVGFPCVIYDDDLSSGPLGKPLPIHIDVNDKDKRGWDPTDPDPANPWNAS